MERLMEYVRAKKQNMNIFEILDIIRGEYTVPEEIAYTEMVENIILASKYRTDIYHYQRVFEEMFRGMELPFHLNWDNFVDLAIGNVIEEMLERWCSESQHFRLEKRETELLRELVKYQFYQSTQSTKGRTRAEIEVFFQKREGTIKNMASFLTGLERASISLFRIAMEREEGENV